MRLDIADLSYHCPADAGGLALSMAKSPWHGALRSAHKIAMLHASETIEGPDYIASNLLISSRTGSNPTKGRNFFSAMRYSFVSTTFISCRKIINRKKRSFLGKIRDFEE